MGNPISSGWGRAVAALAVAAAPGCCEHPSCPNPPNDVAYVWEAKQRITVTQLDDRAIDLAVCLVQSADGPACEHDAQPPVCDTRPPAAVRASLAPVFEKLRGYKLTSPTTAVVEIAKLLPASGDPLVTTAVRDARRQKDCSSTTDGACVAVRWEELWLLLHADQTGSVTSVDVFPNKNLCMKDVDEKAQ
jgi:hypothetical protein